jgi:hypothetical protein
MPKIDHYNGVLEKRQFCLRKLGKIAENWAKSPKKIFAPNPV